MFFLRSLKPGGTAQMSALLCAACWLLPACAAQQAVTLAGMNVTVWSQNPRPEIKQPVIIFSHGFHGCATQSRFLMEAFAGAGYLVFAPNHRDASCGGGAASLTRRAEAPFRQPQSWDESTYRDRADDIDRLIAAIRVDERFRTQADFSRLALAGHSLGGYTVLGLAGAWPGWKLAGVKAVLALSPYSQPYLAHNTLAGLGVPVMFQGGTLDFGITPEIKKNSGAYDQAPAPKYLVEFERAGHFAWADIGITAHQQIIDYSLAFMNRYVKSEPADPLLTHKTAGVATLRYAER